jgi:fucose 4-O-acetylase-like acetyltransferase
VRSGDSRNARRRFATIDWLKSAAIVAVIVTHAGAAAFPGAFGYTKWDTILRMLLASFHVPCLLMISGYLYYRPDPIGWEDVATRLRRILIPYFIASLVVFTLRPAEHPTLASKVAALAMADALSIYYYVFLLVLFVLLLPFFSRIPRWVIRAIVGTNVAILVMQSALSWRWSMDFHWAMRNPLESFALGYFLIGWLAAGDSGVGKVAIARGRYAATLVLAGFWPACVAAGSPYPAIILAKIPYSLSVWQSAWNSNFDRDPAPASVRRISDATYGLFLYHFLAMTPFFGWTASWHPLLRILALTSLGLAGGLAVGALLRAIVGPQRSRDWFGF